MDIVTLAAARKGSGGGASKEYVDEKVAALINDTTAAQDKTYSSAKVEEKVAGEEITTTATGSDLALSTSSGNLNALTVYGKSEVVDGAIVSAGEGWATVDLGTLDWQYSSAQTTPIFYSTSLGDLPKYAATWKTKVPCYCPKYSNDMSFDEAFNHPNNNMKIAFGTATYKYFGISDFNYTDATAFKNSLNGVLLCYQLADPTQDNTIAIKTDNGSGIDGTMAVFTTGTPLRGIPDSNVKDVMSWDGSSGEVTKNCGEVDLGTLTWQYISANQMFETVLPTGTVGSRDLFCAKYKTVKAAAWSVLENKQIMTHPTEYYSIRIKDTDYTDATAFKNSLNGVKLVYELATPTTEQLTTAENDSIAGLRTFSPHTHAQNNAGAEMTVEAYAGTANGKAVNELKQDVQSEISALKITQSNTLTLTTSGWSNNAQTVSYAHDTAKRNVIDVDPASIEEWANCGILATAETASGITFTCKTVPTNALNFRVTSMGVN